MRTLAEKNPAGIAHLHAIERPYIAAMCMYFDNNRELGNCFDVGGSAVSKWLLQRSPPSQKYEDAAKLWVDAVIANQHPAVQTELFAGEAKTDAEAYDECFQEPAVDKGSPEIWPETYTEQTTAPDRKEAVFLTIVPVDKIDKFETLGRMLGLESVETEL